MSYRVFKKSFLFLPKQIMFWLIRNNYCYIMALFYKSFIIKEQKSKDNRMFTNSDRATILAINANTFRGDVECLSQVGNYRILTLNNNWQTLLMAAFTNKSIDAPEYFKAQVGDDMYELKEKIDKFFSGFILSLLKLIKIDCVIAPNFRYIEAFPWVMHFEKSGIPHIMLYREGLLEFERMVCVFNNRLSKFKGYPVTHVIVTNQKCKHSFVETGFISERQVSVHGSLRMDYLLKQINLTKGRFVSKYKGRRKRVILFYFSCYSSIFGKDNFAGNVDHPYVTNYPYIGVVWSRRKDLFRDLHISFIRLAQKLPDVDFVIKVKPEVVVKNNASWREYLKIVNEMDNDLRKLKNYTTELDANVHDLILNSDVVIALQSSTAIESAIAGKPVIFPLFYNYKESENFNEFLWHNHLDLFDVAEGADELEAMIIKRLNNSEIDGWEMEGRRKLFKDCFGDLDGCALKNYAETIENVVTSAKTQRSK